MGECAFVPQYIHTFPLCSRKTQERKTEQKPSVYIEIEMEMEMNGFYFGTGAVRAKKTNQTENVLLKHALFQQTVQQVINFDNKLLFRFNNKCQVRFFR